jgi:glycerol kinase
MSHILALDQGTSSSKAIVFNLTGRVLGVAQHEFDMTFPNPGWVEQDPEVLWRTTLLAGREALVNAGLKGTDIAAIGITNQRETTLVWDRQTGRSLHNAIVWQDRRTADRCDLMRIDGLEETVASTTGLVIDPYFSGTKLAWLLDNVDGLRARAQAGEVAFGTVDTFLIWRLTKGAEHATDATNLLPEVRDSAAHFGIADAEWFGAPIPICGIAGDQQAALIGQGCFQPGMAKSTYGTGCFAMVNTGADQVRSTAQLLTTVAYRLAGKTTYALEGSIFSAGVAVKWLRDQLGLVVDAADTEGAAVRSGGDSGGVYLVPAFTGLGAPHWAPDARGLIAGLTLATDRDQLITATLQSVAFQSQELIAAMAADGARMENLRVDGGMVVNNWLCQFLADMLNLPVERPEITETTALGAAMLATLGAGMVGDLDAATQLWNLDREFQPTMPALAREELLLGWRQAVERALL